MERQVIAVEVDAARPAQPVGRTPRRPWGVRRAALWLASGPALLFFFLPILAIFLRITPAEFWSTATSHDTQQAIDLSLWTTLIATGVTVICGTPLAIFLARRQFFWKPALDTLIDLAMILPPSVAGIALLVAFGREGLLGGFFTHLGITIVFTPIAVIMAQIFVAAPYFIRTLTAALSEVQRDLEDAAALDGANAWQVLQRITLPLVFPAFFAGAVMTWARALGEFGATIIFAGSFQGRTETIPLAIYLGLDVGLQQALALSAVLLVFAFGVLLLVRGLLHRRVSVFW